MQAAHNITALLVLTCLMSGFLLLRKTRVSCWFKHFDTMTANIVAKQLIRGWTRLSGAYPTYAGIQVVIPVPCHASAITSI